MTKYLNNEGLTHFTGKMKGYADGKAGEVDGKVTTHVGNKQNPHGVTKAQVGLGSVDNVQQIPLSQKGVTNGVATLDDKGKVPVEQMPTTKTINGASIFGTGNLQVSASLYKIVDTLPTTGIDTSKIYLVPAESFTTNNYKTEYIYLGDPNKAYDESKWEKIGDEKTNNITPTPGGSITVDTAFNATSSNPIANKTVTKKFGVVDDVLKAKVAQETYDDKMATIDSKLKTLENKTIDVDAELKDSVNPVQNTAVKKAVDDLNTAIGKKANSTDLNAAVGKITTLETNAATILSVTGEGNGISSISKSGNTITAKKGNFLTSAAGLATKNDILPDTLASKGIATKTWVNEQGFATGTIPTNVSQLTNDSGFLTNTALNGYVNEVQPDGTSGNGIANITKEGKILKVTKATFLTEHQSLDGYVNNVKVTGVANGNGIASIAKNGKDINVTQGAFLTAIDGIIAETGEAVAGSGVVDISIRGNKLVKKTGTFVTPATLGDAIDDYASDKGYLTENNLNEKLKETVTIKLVSDKSASDTNLNVATVTVKSGDTTVSTQTWQGTPIKVEVPCDKDVTIETTTVKMYVKPKVLKYIPSPLYNREVTFTYKALELGVFIIDKNDKIYKTTDDFEQSEVPYSDAVGAVLVTDKTAIVIAGNIYNTKWSNKNGLIDGCTVKSNAIEAAQDFAGAANTAAIIKANAGLDTAASKCNNYVFKNGKKGHLMSAGEAIEIQKNFNSINSILEYIDSSNVLIEDSSYWTSTQKDSDAVWGINMADSTLKEYFITYDGGSTLGTASAFPIYSLYD